MCDKMAISAYNLKIIEKDPFLRLQMRAQEDFTRHQFSYGFLITKELILWLPHIGFFFTLQPP